MRYCLLVFLLISGMFPYFHFNSAQSAKYVVLKMDDIIAGSEGTIISERWQRVSDFFQDRNMKAAFGIIGFSLLKNNPEYFNWITQRASTGNIEFWNHGFLRRTQNDSLGEFERSFEEQLNSLRMTDSLANVKLGVKLTAWGPHWSEVNEYTDLALSKIPQIKITFGFPQNPVFFKGVVIPYKISLEYPTHNPNFEAFKANYLNKKDELDFFYLQGHPMSWDDTRWDNFVKVIEFLESENVNFVTPAELLEIIEKKSDQLSD